MPHWKACNFHSSCLSTTASHHLIELRSSGRDWLFASSALQNSFDHCQNELSVVWVRTDGNLSDWGELIDQKNEKDFGDGPVGLYNQCVVAKIP